MAEAFPPLELTQPIPRPVITRIGAKIGLIMIPAVFSLLAPFILLIGFVNSRDKANLQQERFVTTAVIEKVYTEKNRESTYLEADYSFRVDAGQFIGRHQHGKSRLIPSDFATLRVGALAEVTYLPSRPDRSELILSMQTIWADPWMLFKWAIAFTGIILAFCLITAYAVGSVVFRERRLLRWGTIASARIVGEELVRNKGGGALTVTYEFRDRSGRLLKGTRAYVPTSKQLNYPASKELNSVIRDNPTVLYDPRRPSRNLLYPPFAVKCGCPLSVDAAEYRTDR